MPKTRATTCPVSMFATDTLLFCTIKQQRYRTFITRNFHCNQISINFQAYKHMDTEKQKTELEKVKTRFGLGGEIKKE